MLDICISGCQNPRRRVRLFGRPRVDVPAYDPRGRSISFQRHFRFGRDTKIAARILRSTRVLEYGPAVSPETPRVRDSALDGLG